MNTLKLAHVATVTFTRWMDWLQPAMMLLLRIYVANIFWKAGVNKYQSWDSTLWLFENEYQVPILPFELAAYLATSVELFIPVLLVLGLATRYGALVLFGFNAMAVVSYPGMNDAGVLDHQVWGLLILLIVGYGPSRLCLDHYIRNWFNKIR